MYFCTKHILIIEHFVELLHIFQPARHVVFVVSAVLAVLWHWAACVVYVESVFVTSLADIVAVCVVDPLNAVV